MPPFADLTIHASQFPERVEADLVHSLRNRQINHKFHYDSYKQSRKWLALHQAYSPSRRDASCAAMYGSAFADATKRITSRNVHLVGLGCGGGQKDTELLLGLRARGCTPTYSPVDVSPAMVLVARQASGAALGVGAGRGLVCDLSQATDLNRFFSNPPDPDSQRIVTFFGMLPNFEPNNILPQLAEFVRDRDLLLLSANFAPGSDYRAGVRRILPQYDNRLTRDWLLTLLTDVGFEAIDGELRFAAEEFPIGSGLLRVNGTFVLQRTVSLQVHGEEFQFQAGERIRLFFSYRYTPEILRRVLASHGLEELGCWLANSGEEGVVLLQKQARPPRPNRVGL